MTDWLDAKAEAALRAYVPPPLSADFTDRLVSLAEGRESRRLPPVSAPRRDRRGVWTRRRTILFTALGAGLLSAGAAASNLFGVQIRNVPVIGRMVEAVAPAKPAPKAAPRALAAEKDKSRPAPIAQPTSAMADETQVAAIDEAAERRAARMERRRAIMEKRLEAINTRRAAAGLPPLPPGAVGKFQQKLWDLPPAARQEVLRRAREVRQARLEQQGATPSGDAIAQNGGVATATSPRRQAFREYVQSLTPEQRQALRAEMRRRRMAREQAETDAATPQP